jgi:ssDNA-binding Zn-finger/Zn-ribbon topoisomerase 1
MSKPYSTIITKPEPYCPVCGARMVLRRPKPGKTWNPFWGCSQFPECRGTRQIDPQTGRYQDDDDYQETYDPDNYGDE